MFNEGGALTEAPSAHRTPVGPLPGVDLLVFGEVGAAFEALVALLTRVGSLPLVCPPASEMTGGAAGLPALLTRAAPLPQVRSLMPAEV